jgi:hypothetical protein
MGALVSGSILVLCSVVWLVLLVVTGFSILAISAGLLTAVCVLGRTDRATR